MTPDTAATERVWNVVVPVLANLSAASGEQAQGRLVQALERAGFTTWTDHSGEVKTEPFEAEDGTEPDVLP